MQSPPLQIPTTRYPPTHIGEVGRYHAQAMQLQKGCRLDHVLVTGKDRRLRVECIDVGQATVVYVTTVGNKYFELRGCK